MTVSLTMAPVRPFTLVEPVRSVSPRESDRTGTGLARAAQSVITSALPGAGCYSEPSSVALAAAMVAALWSQAPSSDGRDASFGLVPQVFPLPDGGVQIEWHAGENHLEVTAEVDGTLGVLVKREGSSAVEVDLSPTRSPIPRCALEAFDLISDAVWGARPPY